MKNIAIKLASLLTAAAALAAPLASCSGKTESSSGAAGIHSDDGNLAGNSPGDVYVAEDNLPYGATVMQLTPGNDGVSVITEYDYRFLSVEEAKAVEAYLSSLALKDVSLLESSTYPDSLSRRLSNSGDITAQEFLDAQYEQITEYTGGDFSFNYYLINNVLQEGETDFTAYDSLVLDSSPNAQITDRKYVQVECLYELNDGGNYSLSNRIGSDIVLYVYTIDGGTYVLT